MVVGEHVFDLIPAYALNCLDEEDAIQVGEHLKHCPACQAELRSYTVVVEQLPLAAPQVEPSPHVRQALLARLENTSVVGEKPSPWVRLGNMFKVSSPAWGLASLALVVILLASNLTLWRQVSRLEANPDVPALQVVNLNGTEYAPGATGMIVISQNGEYGTLVVDHLPGLSPEEQYQLWLIQDGKRTSGGVFSVSDEGYASLVISSPRPLVDFVSFGITIEPAGGSPGPTGERVLGGNL